MRLDIRSILQTHRSIPGSIRISTNINISSSINISIPISIFSSMYPMLRALEIARFPSTLCSILHNILWTINFALPNLTTNFHINSRAQFYEVLHILVLSLHNPPRPSRVLFYEVPRLPTLPHFTLPYPSRVRFCEVLHLLVLFHYTPPHPSTTSSLLQTRICTPLPPPSSSSRTSTTCVIALWIISTCAHGLRPRVGYLII